MVFNYTTSYAALTKTDWDASLGLAVVYGFFFAGMITRLFWRSQQMTVYILASVMAAIRLVTFVMRYYTQDETVQNPERYKVWTAAITLMLSGFYLFIQLMYELVTQWYYTARSCQPCSRNRTIGDLVRHLVLAALFVIGIVGITGEGLAIYEDLSTSRLTRDRSLRLASAAGLLGMTVSLTVLATVASISAFKSSSSSSSALTSSGYNDPNAPHTDGAPTAPHGHGHGRRSTSSDVELETAGGKGNLNRSTAMRCITSPSLTGGLIGLACSMLLLEAIYRLIYAINDDRNAWIITEAAVDVFVFMPEAVVFLMLTFLDFSQIGSIGLWKGKPRSKVVRDVIA